MTHRSERDEVRGALYRGDEDALLPVLLGRVWPDDALQVLGDAVLVAAGACRHAVEPAARRCVEELNLRDWEGDAELAAQLEAAFGWGPTPLLRRLPVDLEELAGILEGDPLLGGGRIDLHTGQVWPQAVLDYGEEVDDVESDEDDGESWLPVHSEGSHAGYRDMEQFIDTIADESIAERLARSIQGKGAFRRFKDTLASWPDLLHRWCGLKDDRQRGRARAWLAAEGYTPTPVQPEP